MLSILRFIFNFIADFCSMLFSIQIDDGLSFGLLMCIVFIFLPMMLRVVNFLKKDAIEELADNENKKSPSKNFSKKGRRFK